MHYMRALLPSSVKPAFDKHDFDGRGLLDMSRTRDALLDLGCRLTLGEVAMLVRRHGAYLPGCVDATVSFSQFVSLVEHVRHAPIGPVANLPIPTSPLSLAPRPPMHDVFPSALEVEAGRPKWYGFASEAVDHS